MNLPAAHNLVLIRHGQSEANKLNIFTGWRDSPLSDRGVQEASEAGRALKSAGFSFDLAFTSLQSRAIKTLWILLEKMDLMWLPVQKHWRLNERHYGSLQGKNKLQAVADFGEAQVHEWRRSYSTRPPQVSSDSEDFPGNEIRYSKVPTADLPKGESLADVLARVVPYWQQEILPHLNRGSKVIIAAHGNSLRALIKHLEFLTDEEIQEMNLPTGVPRLCKIEENGRCSNSTYLGNPEDILARTAAVQNQTKR